jgi:hypothetical protein
MSGKWTIQQHLNYAFVGQSQSEVPGGFAPNHSLQGSPELAYGITKRWEIGFYTPFAVNGGRHPLGCCKNPQPLRGPRRRQAKLLLRNQL